MKKIFPIIVIVLISSFVNGQGHWGKISQPTDRVLKHVFFVDSLTGWCAGADGLIFYTTDGAVSWLEQNSTVTTFIVDLFFLNKNLGWALTYRNVPPFGSTILSTTNGGNEWIANDFPEDNVFMNAVFYFDSLNGWLGGSKITSTTDGGLTWQDAKIDSNFVSGLPVLNFNFYSRQFGYACGGFLDLSGVIWRTTDFGKNWSATGVSPDEIFDIFLFDSLKAITLSGDPEGFFGIGDIKSSDAGESWNYTELPLTALSFAIDFRTSTEGWSASGFKFLFSPDSGVTWEQIETPDSAVVFDLMFTDSLTGYAVGEGGLVLKYIFPHVEEPLPHKFSLYQNYPNPFNLVTNIKFDIPQTIDTFKEENLTVLSPQLPQNSNNKTTLKVYDILGNEIVTLVNDYLPPGKYNFKFGVPFLASGVYIYQLISAGYVQTKKMVLLK
jgi:photosystem II stability/assembly factor-like uncharacterized protein